MIDWDDVDQIAFGQLGWTPNEYKLFSLDEFYNAYKGLDKLMQQHWSMARQIGYYTMISQGHGKTIKKPNDLFKLGIDENKNKEEVPKKYATVKRIK